MHFCWRCFLWQGVSHDTRAAESSAQENSGAQPLAVLVEGSGTYGRSGTAQTAAAQSFFDQGLRLVWGYYAVEAAASPNARTRKLRRDREALRARRRRNEEDAAEDGGGHAAWSDGAADDAAADDAADDPDAATTALVAGGEAVAGGDDAAGAERGNDGEDGEKETAQPDADGGPAARVARREQLVQVDGLVASVECADADVGLQDECGECNENLDTGVDIA